MVRRPMPIREVLYEPRDGPRGAGGVAHLDRKIQEIFGHAKFGLSPCGAPIPRISILLMDCVQICSNGTIEL
jgi:hypothetical protein